MSLALLSLLFPVKEVRALGEDKPWFGGLYSGFSGYSERTGLPAAEYLSAGLFAEPFAVRVFNPALFCGLLIPIAPADCEGLRIQVAGELTIVDLPAPVLKRRFYVSSCWSPGLGAEYLVSFDLRTASFSALLAPLRFRVGDAVFTLGAFQLFLGEGARLQGWGFTLFKAALFIF